LAPDTKTITAPRLPDLPALESVESNGWWLAWMYGSILLVLAAILAFAVCLTYSACHQFGTDWWMQPTARAIGLGVFAVAVLVCSFLIRLPDYLWRTDPEGMTVLGIGRRRFVAWSQVESVKVKTSGGVPHSYGLVASHGTIWIGMNFGAGVVGVASAWQHLRRFGKADDAMLAGGAGAYWVPLPDDTPIDMDWHNPHAPNWPLSFGILILSFFAVLVWYFHGSIASHGSSFFSHFFFTVVPAAYAAVRKRLMTASACTVRSDRFEARTAWGAIDFLWSDLAFIQCAVDSVTVRGKGPRSTAIIPYKISDPESVRVVCCIIRNARAAGHLVPIPSVVPLATVLQKTTTDELAPEPGDVAELKPQTAYVVLTMVAVLAVTAVVWQVFHLGFVSTLLSVVIPIAFGLCLAAGCARYFRTLRADDTGITVTMLWRERTIYWHQVAVYWVKPMKMPDSMISKLGPSAMVVTLPMSRKLKDITGHVILDLSTLYGREEDRRRFIAYLDAKLAAVRREEV